MSSIARDLLRRHRLTATEYRRMGEVGILRADARVELIEGEIIDMTPTGSRHAGVVRHIARLFERAIGDSAVVSIQSPVSLSDRSEPEPDIALLSPRTDFYKSAHPRPADVLLIVEVADASLRYDRQVKVPLYARHGVTEVWIVDLERNVLTQYRDPEGERYRTATSLAELAAVELAALPGVRLDLRGVFRD
ncbi:MAG TPA: Uma2 family endonuclease [Gammaproteobacteria bacterium]